MRYGGSKALDAEIKIDFSGKQILMDYSTVKGMARYDSNHSVFKKDDWKTQPFHIRILYILWIELLRATGPVFALYQLYFLSLVNHGWITDADAHYDHQCLLKYYNSFTDGTCEKSRSGPLESKRLAFLVPSNMFIDYQLTGDYKEKISSIALTRRYLKFKQFGRFERIRQAGWLMTFEFSSPPQDGSCTVEFLA